VVHHTSRLSRAAQAAAARQAAPKADGARLVGLEIRALTVRLVGPDGSHAVVSLSEALAQARAAGRDLVQVDGASTPPVCRLLDVGALRAAERAKEKVARRKAVERRHSDVTKDFRLGTRTAQHDLHTRAAQAGRALRDGHKARLAVVFKSVKELGEPGARARAADVLELFRQAVYDEIGGSEHARVDAEPKMDALTLACRLSPSARLLKGAAAAKGAAGGAGGAGGGEAQASGGEEGVESDDDAESDNGGASPMQPAG
jgi:translation initiation factor IF-3